MPAGALIAARPGPARDLLALTKPGVTSLNLVAAAAGFVLAGGASPGAFLATLAGTALVAASANGLNCYLERDLDRLMARTRDRPLAARRLPLRLALVFCLVLALSGLPLLGFGANPLAAAIAALALLDYVFVYTPLKRRTPAALAFGALAGAAPPLIGWVGARGAIGPPGLLLFALLFFWQLPHFLAFALWRLEDCSRGGLRVLPLERGTPAARGSLLACQLITVGISVAFVPVAGARVPYLVAALALGGPTLAEGLRGLRGPAGPAWARGFFLATNRYLVLLLGALVLDRWVR